MKDHMIRGTGFGSQVRFFAASTKETVEEARRIHDTYPLCTAALGRLLTAGAMMGAMGKNDTDIITLRIDGDGTIRVMPKPTESVILFDPIKNDVIETEVKISYDWYQ